MIVTVKTELTWEGVNKNFANQSEKKLKRTLKDMTGASDVEINEVNCWDEDGENNEDNI